jgi:transcription antitermination protein NusB
MALPQQKFREIVFQMLYSADFAKGAEGDLIPLLMQHLAVSRSSMRKAELRRLQVEEHLSEIDRLIASASASYDFARIPGVERNVLRLSVYELMFDEEIPAKVAISEGIRLCRKFATAEGANFINAVLDHLYQIQLKEAHEPAVSTGQTAQ